MILSLRRNRLAAAASLALLACAVHAQSDPAAPTSPAPIIQPSAPPTPGLPPKAAPPAVPSDITDGTDPARPSALTADLFYEIVVGEMTARSGDAGAGYQLVLDAAQRLRDGKLFQRAVEIALQSRSGGAALTAVRAWKDALPDSRDARRFELQILVALNRLEETVDPLRAEVAATSPVERPLLMAVIVRSYSRASDKKLAASVVERALVDELKNPEGGGMAWAAVGQLRLAAGDASGALDAARKGQAVDPGSDGPPALALELLGPDQPLAEPIVARYLDRPKASPELRMAYARVLTENRRFDGAAAQLQALTAARPELPQPWLLLGSLQAQLRQNAAAEASLKHYLELAAKAQPTANAAADASGDGTDSNRAAAAAALAAGRARGNTQAYLLLSQLAERRKDYAEAERWLSRIDSTDELVLAQTRRAGLLAREGKLPQARELVRSLPENTPADKKQKFLAEVQLLRDAKQYQAAYDMLAQAATATPGDTDLIYDQAMMAEKLNRIDEMERLLRQLIQLKPDNQNAYNALGYSMADRGIRLEEARTLIQQAVKLAPDDPFIADSLGWVEFRLGHMAEATHILETAYKARPDPEIGAHLGEVLWANGQKDRAVAVWKESLLGDPDNETLQETLKRLRVKL